MRKAPSIRLADLVDLGLPSLLDQHGHHLTMHQRKALRAIAGCRTGAFGATVMSCSHCHAIQYRLRSCGHRSCPRCQHHTAQQWLQRQQAKLLPVEYFMATFTLPSALRATAYRQPRIVYPALFSAAAATLKRFGLTHPKLTAQVGFCAVLHTHSRRLDYHPHLHVVIPAGGIDKTESRGALWRALDKRYLFNGFALARVFRAKLIDALRRGGVDLPPSLPKKWVVHCKHVGHGLPALKYLSRYLTRGVLSEHDLVQYDKTQGTVTFRYRDARTRRFAYRTLQLADFLWRIALHVLPRGFQRVRNYGFLHGNAKRLLAGVQWALRIVLPPFEEHDPKRYLCDACGSPMRVSAFLPPRRASG